jgi:hypothetical protein
LPTTGLPRRVTSGEAPPSRSGGTQSPRTGEQRQRRPGSRRMATRPSRRRPASFGTGRPPCRPRHGSCGRDCPTLMPYPQHCRFRGGRPTGIRPAPPASTTQRKKIMYAPSNDRKTWLRRLILAAIAGPVSGAARALMAWALNHWPTQRTLRACPLCVAEPGVGRASAASGRCSHARRPRERGTRPAAHDPPGHPQGGSATVGWLGVAGPEATAFARAPGSRRCSAGRRGLED